MRNISPDPGFEHPLCQAARVYTKAGFPVFPVRSNDKKPLGAFVPHGFKDATLDPAKIKQWLRSAPDARLGIAVPEGFIVIDVDPDKGGTADGLPDTLVQRTPSGGSHHLYRVEPGRFPGKLRKGVDLKGNGTGYVLSYDGWEGGFDLSRCAPFPVELLDVEATSKSNGEDHSRPLTPSQRKWCLEQLDEMLGKIKADDYLAEWIPVGMILKSEDIDFERWVEWSKTSSEFTSEAECEKKWASFKGKGLAFGTLARMAGMHIPPPLPEEEFDVVANEPPNSLRSVELTECHLKGSTWLIQGTIEQGAVVATTGEPGSGKSFFGVDCGLHIVTGTTWFGRKVAQGSVLYVAAEAPNSIRRRIALAYHVKFKLLEDETPPLRIVIEAPLLGDPHRSQKDAQRVLDKIKAMQDAYGQPVLAVFYDTVAGCMGNGAENLDGMQRLCARVNWIANETGAAQFLNHHPNAAGGDLRGHGSLKGTVSTILKIENRDGVRVVTSPKMRDAAGGELFAYLLEPHPIGLDNFGDPETSCIVQPTDIPTSTLVDGESKLAFIVKEAMQAIGDGEIKFGGIVQEVAKRFDFGNTGFDGRRKAVSRALKVLEEAGQATKSLERNGYYRLLSTPKAE